MTGRPQKLIATIDWYRRLPNDNAIVGEVLRFLFPNVPKPILEIGRQFEWFSKPATRLTGKDLVYIVNFVIDYLVFLERGFADE